MRRLEFGWFLPTWGDTTAYGLESAFVAPSLELFDKLSGEMTEIAAQVPALFEALSGMNLHDLMTNVKSMAARPNGSSSNGSSSNGTATPSTRST